MSIKEKPAGYLFSRTYTNYIFVLLFLLFMFDYIDRYIVSSMLISIEKEWGITHTQSGLLISAIYWSIILLTFPVSVLIDRWSRSKTIGIMAIMWCMATALCALTGNFMQLFMARILIGIGEAGYSPGGTAMISGLYPQEKRARMLGIWNASIPLGIAIGVVLGGIISVHWGWRHAFGLVAFPGLIISILFLFVKDYKTISLTYSNSESLQMKMSKKDIFREFITKPSLIFSYFGITCVVFVTTALSTWLPRYFQETWEITQSKAGYMAGLVMVLAIVGAPSGGYIADKWKKSRSNARLLFPALSTLIAGILLFAALVLFKGKMQFVIFLLFGILVTSFISALAVTQDVVHPGLRAVSFAIAVIIQNLIGSSMAPIVVGKIYDLSNIQTALAVLPFVLIVASILFYAGSRYYEKDISKVSGIQLEAMN